MADAPPKVIDSKTKALEYLKNLETEALKRVGKPGFNPFIWVKNTLRNLEQQVKGGDAKAIEAALALKIPDTVKDAVTEIDIPTNK